MDKQTRFLVIGFAILMGISFLYQAPEQKIDIIPGEWDISKQVEDRGYNIYLIEERDFDYSNPDVYNVAQEIKKRTSTPEEAIRETLKFVVRNVRYSSAITIDECFDEKASTVLRSGVGDCVSMSRLSLSLLRSQGIPTRSVGGCLSATQRCIPIFAVIPALEAQVTEMSIGDFKKRGFLHEWIEIWTPEEGWRIAEATSAQIFSTSCYSTGYLMYHYDTNPKDRCVILSSNFWEKCRAY